MALISKVPRRTLAGKMHERNSNSRVTMDETTIKFGKAEEGLNILDFLWLGPILDNLDLV